MANHTAPISLAGPAVGETPHVCAFFNSNHEEYRVLPPFIKDGFDYGDRAIHVANPDQRLDHDPGQFTADAVIDILRTHPIVIIGGPVRQNPFYVPRETLLPECRARRAKQALPGSTVS